MEYCLNILCLILREWLLIKVEDNKNNLMNRHNYFSQQTKLVLLNNNMILHQIIWRWNKCITWDKQAKIIYNPIDKICLINIKFYKIILKIKKA